MGHKLSSHNDNKIYKDTLRIAKKYHDKTKRLVIHSDHGYQYIAMWMRNYAKRNNIIISLSRIGNSFNNAICETFFSQLKQELPTSQK